MKSWMVVVAALAAPAWGLEVNTASEAELVAAGLRQAEARNIVTARQQQGSFRSVADLLGVAGVSQGDLNRVRGTLTVAGEAISTRSGTRPAVPGQRPAEPANKIDDDGASHEAAEHAAGDDHGTDAGKTDDHGKGDDSGKGGEDGKGGDDSKGGDSGKGGDDGKGGDSGKGGDDGKGGDGGKGGDDGKGGDSGKGGGHKGNHG